MTAWAWTRATLFCLAIGTISTACSRTQIEFGDVDQGNVGGDAGSGFGGNAGVGGFGGSLGGSGGVGGAGGVAGVGAVGGSAGTGGISSCESEANSSCEQCTCDACLPEWQSCDDDGGCLAILDCADQNGCSGISCYLGPCNDVIDQNGGPFGQSAGLAQDVGQCRQDSACPCGSGGSGVSGGSGGGGGTGGSSGNGGAGGSGGTGPLACFTCITQKCPAVGECLLDQQCRDGAICTFQQCLGGGGGFPNFQCVLGCFNGDFQSAIKAFQAFQCFFSQCSSACQGGIPGFPGGGFGGSGGNP